VKIDAPIVLVVDRDSAESRSLVARLSDPGWRVVFVHDGEAAIHALSETRVDCLVTELRIQRIDGLAVLARARKLNPEVCAVVITEGGDVATEHERGELQHGDREHERDRDAGRALRQPLHGRGDCLLRKRG